MNANGVDPTALHVAAGEGAADRYDLIVTPESAGWAYSSLRTFTLDVGGELILETEGEEMFVVPLSGSARVSVGEQTYELAGRVDVFSGPTDMAYLPIRCTAVIASTDGGRFALTGARTEVQLPFRYGPMSEVPVELRGAGQASRMVRNFGTVDAFETGAVIACEVITPAGNWSSYPAHKHDEAGATESELEEIYYYEISAGPNGEPGFGYHQTSSSSAGEIEVLTPVRDRDVVLVPFGWHGPCVAAPGFDMYYLNVMAGPPRENGERAWLISDHPEHAFVRGSWDGQSVDPRLTTGYGSSPQKGNS